MLPLLSSTKERGARKLGDLPSVSLSPLSLLLSVFYLCSGKDRLLSKGGDLGRASQYIFFLTVRFRFLFGHAAMRSLGLCLEGPCLNAHASVFPPLWLLRVSHSASN